MALRKVLVVVGTTGAGKTKLSVDLAKAVGGEVINSDAMQLYRGLDIATAKASVAERDGVPHHLLDVVEPSGRVDVLAFKALALAAIEDVLARGKVPIIVGGTMYYTQALLWKAQLLDDVDVATAAEPSSDATLDALTPEQLYKQLRDVDPAMAARLHVNNVRKVQRSLQVFRQTGTPHSEHLARQEREQLQLDTYFDACAFWVHCSKPVLAERLATRVDTMIRAGLADEIRGLRAIVRAHPPRLDAAATTAPAEHENAVGILQAIGYKEFQPYFDALEAQQEEKATPAAAPDDLQRVFDDCVEQLNVATRQYARRQLTWIRNRFVTRNIPVYQVDSSDIAQWGAAVATPATRIAEAFLAGRAVPEPYTSVQAAQPDARELSQADKHSEKLCEICGGRKLTGTKEWAAHVASKGHRFHLKRLAIEASGEGPAAFLRKKQARADDGDATRSVQDSAKRAKASNTQESDG
ncbi:hypothetical protein PybrP1_002364 [[Pythium] brassicae (nom. inval.)]|nr:hypothetical protein PybrP1_002364 [[Pythium] brassicae (nom. inval.)]